LKEKIGQAKGARDLMNDLGEPDRRALTHRDFFYAAQEEESEYDDEDVSWEDSDDLFD